MDFEKSTNAVETKKKNGLPYYLLDSYSILPIY